MTIWKQRAAYLLLAVSLAACSREPQMNPTATSSIDAKSESSGPQKTATHHSKTKEPTQKQGSDEQSMPPPEIDLRTPFRQVLNSGFKRAPEGVDREYCIESYEALLATPETSRRFLEKKLRNGRPNEKPLAIHLLGELGPAAGQSARYLADVVMRSWEVSLNRCLAKKKGLKVAGKAVDSTDEERIECVESIGYGRAPASVRMACHALARIGAPKSATRLMGTGMGGYYANPCIRFFLMNDLESPAAQVFIDREMRTNPNGALINTMLLSRRNAGVEVLIRQLEARVRSDKVPEELPCDLGVFAEKFHARGGILNKLSQTALDTLKAMASGRLDPSIKVPGVAQSCARRALAALSAPPVANPAPFPKMLASVGMGPFCPQSVSQGE